MTKGDISDDMKVKNDPVQKSTLVKAFSIFNPGGFVDECRRYAHTLQKGKTRDDAIDEFNDRVEALYTSFGEPLPPPIPIDGDQPPLVSDEPEEDEGVYPKTGNPALVGGNRHNGVAQSETTSEGSSVTISSTAGSSAAISAEGGLAAWNPKNMLSEKWWTPQRGFLVAGATGLAASLIAGGIYLANKFIRRKKQVKEQKSRRAHARSWNSK